MFMNSKILLNLKLGEVIGLKIGALIEDIK